MTVRVGARPPEGLPEALEGWAWLSPPVKGRGIARARLGGVSVAVRLVPPGDALEGRAELAVLASVDHPGLARLIDHGTLPGGAGSYVVRSWVDGPDLLRWAREGGAASVEELGRVVARVCPALQHLHRRGFVHGDLKATNIIVREGASWPEPVVTDFGLSRASGEAGEGVTGTLFHVAPELLLGGALTPAADLFALGATLHQLLIGRRPSASEFYGRFPREDYFAATDSRPDELPGWARDVVESLLARDPAARPASAERLGRTLAGRLGIPELFGAEPLDLRWPALQGRERWVTEWWRRVREAMEEGHPACVLDWIRIQAGEELQPVIDGLALHAALDGAPVRRLDLERGLATLANSAALDAWAGELAGRHAGQVLFASPRSSDAWQARGVEALARTLRLASPRSAPAGATTLVVVSSAAPLAADSGWRESDLPAPSVADVERFLGELLSGGDEPTWPERRAHLAALVHASGRGTAAGIEAALRAAAEQGWLLRGDERPRLRSGPLPERLVPVHDEGASPALDGDAARLWAVLQAAGGRVSLASLEQDTGTGARELASALDTLARVSLVQVRREAEGTRVEALRAGGEGWARALEEEPWRALNGRLARRLRHEGAPGARSLAHAFVAGEVALEDVLERTRALREEGLAELSLELLARLADLERGRAEPARPELQAERAFAWCALGQSVRALDEIEPLRGSDEAAVRALVARVEGDVAAQRNEFTRALEHFEAARALDPHDGGAALLGQAQLLFESRSYDAVERLVSRLRQGDGERAALAPRVWNNLRALEAMSAFRRGQIVPAREALRIQLQEARAEGNALREASLALNLATLERRAGDLPAASTCVERAIQLYDAAGNLSGLAQARALSGGALREAGRLREAEPLIASALALRERLGDRVGAVALRGMLGLVYAERGRVRPALAELERSAEELRASGRGHDAALLEARARELRARLGLHRAEQAASRAETGRVAEGDPRTLLALARAAWLQDDPQRCADLAVRAGALGATLGLSAVQEEAVFLDAALAARFQRSPGESRAEVAGTSLAAQDRALCELLSSAPLDAAAVRELARTLEQAGRDDRAARAWIALSVRAADEPTALGAAARAAGLIEVCTSGASAPERTRLERCLLGFPDPWPEDLVAWRQRTREPDDLEDEVIELLDINRRLLAQEDLRSLLGAIVEQALSVSGAQRGFIVLEEAGELVVDTALDSRRGGIDESEVELSGSALRRALESMRPVRVSNAVDDPLLGSAPSVIALELRSILCVPFRADKGLRGVVYVDHRLREAAFDERAERMLRLLADQAALAILQVRRMEEIRRLNRELGKQVVAVQSDLRTARKALIEAGLPAPAGGLVGNAMVMQDVRRLLERAAGSKLSVLITGASGTGKELAARALHELSPRAEGPFVSENCAALPPSLIEAELFGARKGAYTGADRDREGLFERAHGGTLFLDEIGDLPLDLQAKLLRVLETSEVRRLGDERARKVDFRLVVATNRDPEGEVRAGRFRSDLYYRLAGVPVRMPPLSDREQDIPALVDHFLRLQEREDGIRRGVSRAVLARLARRPWPGNVRELRNEVARLCLHSEGDLVDPGLVSEPADTSANPTGTGSAVKPLAELEREAIQNALSVTGGDKTEAARRLGISRAKIYQRLKEWGSEDGP